MEIVVRKDLSEWIQFVTDWVIRQKSSGARSLYLPAGETPKPLYEAWRDSKVLSDLTLIQIDELLRVPDAASFSNFFKAYLPKHKIEACDRGDILGDVAILGLGSNGHVGFHEPGLPRSFFSGCVKLESATCERLQVSKNTWGVTYGVGAFLRCKSVLVIVRGSAKRNILKQVISEPRKSPAGLLLDHPKITILCDFDI